MPRWYNIQLVDGDKPLRVWAQIDAEVAAVWVDQEES